MRILITNDDGISAPGLAVTEAIAQALAGSEGEVWVVAPAFEQSAVSHCISYIRPMGVEKLAPRRFAVDGSPADCVLVALNRILKDTPPDLILSGVNKGHNVAEDIVYSGTIAGAMEGAMHGFKSIALSQYYGQRGVEMADAFEIAAAHGLEVCRKILENAPWQNHTYGVFYSVNFPNSAPKGIKATIQGHRPNPTFDVAPQVAPNGREYLWLSHSAGNAEADNGTDAREAARGWITVTPLRADLTAHDMMDQLAEVF
ncbi:MAG: 5'/3'-nucleotidase SurE [Paracoccaceae bacterium]